MSRGGTTGIRIKGKALKETLVRFQYQAPLAAANGSFDAAQQTMILAKELAPFEEGDMEMSGYVAHPTTTAAGATTVAMGFGGPSEAYVVRQHEDFSLNHPGQRAIQLGVTKVGVAGWLSEAINKTRNETKRTIQEHIAHFIKTGRLRPVKRQVPSDPWGRK